MRALLLIGLVACGGSPAAKPVVAPSAMTAQQIVDRVVQTYAHAKSYSDTGTYSDVSSESKATKTFATAYTSLGFRFEYRDDGDPARAYTIWTDKDTAYTTSYLRPGFAESNDIYTALGSAIGVSGMTSFVIPSLLFADIPDFTQLLKQVTRAGEEVIDGHPCVRLHADLRGATTLSIDRDSFLIRRITHATTIDHDGKDVDVTVTINYQPHLDEPVAAAQLAGPDLSKLKLDEPDRPKWIGVFFAPTSAEIERVIANSPAEKAGLKDGDTIVSFDGTPVAKGPDVIAEIAKHKPQDKVDVVVKRSGKQVTVPLTIEVRPDADDLQRKQLLDKAAPGFDLAVHGGNGTRIRLADLKGKVVVLDFWATWCKPCEASLPLLAGWHKKYSGSGLTIVGISDEDAADISAYLAEHKIPYGIAIDAEHKAWRDYLVQGLPTTIVIDKGGVVRFVEVGLGDGKDIEAAIAKLLK